MFFGGGQDHDRKGPRPGVGADPLQDLEPIDSRQLQVEQNDGRQHGRIAPFVFARCEEIIQSFGSVANDHYVIGDTRLLERSDRQLLVCRVVFDQ